MVRVNQILQKIFLNFLRVYKYFISPLLGERCRFYPSCSQFAEQAVSKYGPWKAIFLILSRILRCHPFHPGGYDPLP